nr:MAG TPA: hypothetical protein [Caudoviricetes sp.]
MEIPLFLFHFKIKVFSIFLQSNRGGSAQVPR